MSDRRTALIAGVLYLLTFASIPTLGLYRAVRADGFLLGSGTDRQALAGAALEVVVALTCAGTAVVLYPVLRRVQPAVALGFVAARVIEAALILTGVACILTLVSLRSGAAIDPAVAVPLGRGLSALYGNLFLVSQSLMPGLNALLLGSLLWRARLVPRAIPLIGLIGAPVHLAAVALTLLGLLTAISPVTLIAALPIAVWEFALGVWLVVRGFGRTTSRAAGHRTGAPSAPVVA